MTNNQINLYWRLWTAAAKKQGWTTQNGLTGKQISELRHTQHIAALGSDKSMKDLSNHQFDLIKAHFQLLANDTHLAAAVALTDPGKRRP
jgi:hypothetical protein